MIFINGFVIPQIKICGLTSVEEAGYLNENHVDFAGFVLYYPKSKRNISIDNAKLIMDKLDSDIKKVAVVVSPKAEQIREIYEAGFDYIQIHGEYVKEFFDDIKLPVLKAFNISDMNVFESYSHDERIKGYVFDAAEPGSGKAFDWNILNKIERDGKLFFLAGGLNEENVKKAIDAVKPDAVDVSSGVEYGERQGKDPEKIVKFIQMVRN